MKADRTVILIGVFLSLLGLAVAWEAYGYIQIERGWAMVISGVTGASTGFVLIAFGLVLNQLQKIAASAAQAVLFLSKVKATESPAAPLYAPSVAAAPLAPVEKFSPPPSPVAGVALAGAAVGLAAAAAKAESGGEEAASAAPSWKDYAPKPPAWMSRETTTRDFELESEQDPGLEVDAPSYVPPVDPDSVFSSPGQGHGEALRLADLNHDWIAHTAAGETLDNAHDVEPGAAWPSGAPAAEPEDAPVWAEAAPETTHHVDLDAPPEPDYVAAPDLAASPDWVAEADAMPSEEFALKSSLSDEAATVEKTPAAELEKEAEVAPRPAVMGQYEANGARYVMYVDGSIDAETSHGVYHFKSMEELKLFIEQEV